MADFERRVARDGHCRVQHMAHRLPFERIRAGRQSSRPRARVPFVLSLSRHERRHALRFDKPALSSVERAGP